MDTSTGTTGTPAKLTRREESPRQSGGDSPRAAGLWERRPKESAKAFEAWRLYLGMGSGRSLAKVAEKLGKGKRLMEEWSVRWAWRERLRAFVDYEAGLEREAIEARAEIAAVEWAKVTESVRRDAWRASEEILAAAREMLKRWYGTTRAPAFDTVVRGFEVAIRLKQIAAGMPAEIKEVQSKVAATIDVRWEEELRRAYGPKAVGAVVDAEVVGGDGVEGRAEKGEGLLAEGGGE